MSFLRPRVAAVAACLVFISAFAAGCTEPQQARGGAKNAQQQQAPSDRYDRDR
jgi:hypothetical protein